MTPVVRTCVHLAACLGAVGLAAAHAYADSNVQVDTTVLDDLGPPRNTDTGGPVVLTPPHREISATATKPIAETKSSGVDKNLQQPKVGQARTSRAETRHAAKSVSTPGEPAVAAGTGGYRIVFAKGSADLPGTADGVLAPLVKTLAANPAALLSVEAYAEGGEAGAESARRLALSRGLAVRRYLEAHGIAGARALIDARNGEAGGGPADRVDLAIAKN